MPGTFNADVLIKPPEPTEMKAHGRSFLADLPVRDTTSGLYEGAYVRVPITDTGNFSRYDEDGVIDWTVNIASLQAVVAAVDIFTGHFFYDGTNHKIYFIAVDTTTTEDTWYLMSIAVGTGVVTNVGSVGTVKTAEATTGLLYYGFMSRTNITSGDFTIYDGSEVITIDSSDGSVVTALATIAQDGFTLDTALSFSYANSDGSLLTGVSSFQHNTTNYTQIVIYRGGQSGTVYRDLGEARFFPTCISTAQAAPRLWDGNIIIAGDSTTASRYGVLATTRAEFDRWLTDIADKLGLPE